MTTSSTTRLCVSAAAFAGCLLATRLVAFAQNELRVTGHFAIAHQFEGNLERFFYDADESGATAFHVGFTLMDQQQHVESYISARAAWGALRYVAQADSIIPGFSRYSTNGMNGSMTGSASFNEQVVVNAPGVAPGTPGAATATFNFRGSFHTDDNGVSQSFGNNSEGNMDLRLDVSINGSTRAATHGMRFNIFRGQRRACIDNGGCMVVGPGAGSAFDDELTIPFNFSFGVPFEVSAVLSQEGGAFSANEPGNGLTIVGDALHTASWGGLSNVMADGTPVADFTAIGQTSGTSYRDPIAIPEPAAGPLLCLAASGLFLLRNR